MNTTHYPDFGSSNEIPYFFRFARLFASFHSNAIIFTVYVRYIRNQIRFIQAIMLAIQLRSGRSIKCTAWLAVLVDMPSVTDLHKRYNKKLICHFIYDSVHTLSDPVALLP